MKKRILIVDDHPLSREGLIAVIKRDPGFEVIAEAGTAGEGLRQAEICDPDLVIVDISLPDMSGIELVKKIVALHPGARILVFSMHAQIDYIAEALQAGAAGYVIKESSSETLLQGLRTVSRGNLFIDGALPLDVMSQLIKYHPSKSKVTDSSYGILTSREQEVLRLLAEGGSIKDIAGKLCISEKTAQNHRTNIMSKLGLETAVDLVRYAARIGLIDVESWMR